MSDSPKFANNEDEMEDFHDYEDEENSELGSKLDEYDEDEDDEEEEIEEIVTVGMAEPVPAPAAQPAEGAPHEPRVAVETHDGEPATKCLQRRLRSP